MTSLDDPIKEGMVMDFSTRAASFTKDAELVFSYLHQCDGDEGLLAVPFLPVEEKCPTALCRYCECPTDSSDGPKAAFPFKT
jgi:hypothetical protein